MWRRNPYQLVQYAAGVKDGVQQSEAPDSVVEFDEVSRLFGDTVALDSISFSVGQGEFFSIIGPSGSGKTTTVRMIAGLEEPTGGTVRLFGRDVTAVPPHRRGTPMVFQSYALFPHLNIRDNVAYGLRMRRVSKPERRNRADDLLALVGLEGLGDRRTEQLSGGQQQRDFDIRSTWFVPGHTIDTFPEVCSITSSMPWITNPMAW